MQSWGPLKRPKRAKNEFSQGNYRHLDINFDNLILAYSAPVPVDHFYKVVFGKTLAQYNESKRIEDMTELQKEKDQKRREREKNDEKKEKNAEEVIINQQFVVAL